MGYNPQACIESDTTEITLQSTLITKEMVHVMQQLHYEVHILEEGMHLCSVMMEITVCIYTCAIII